MIEKNILITGNGYDLAYGLKTRFSDFFIPIVKRYLMWIGHKPFSAIHYEINNYTNSVYTKYMAIESPTQIEIDNEDSFFSNQFISVLMYYFFFDVYVYKRIYDLQDILPKICSESNIRKMYELQDPISNQWWERFDKFIQLLHSLTLSMTNDIKWMDVEYVIKDLVSENIHIPHDNYELAKLFSEIKAIQGFYYNADIFKTINYDFSNISYKECKQGLDEFSRLFREYLAEICKNKISTPDDFPLSQEYTHAISLNYTPTFKQSIQNPDDEHICYIHGDYSNDVVIGTESFYFNADTRSEYNFEKIPFFKFFQRIIYKTDTEYLNWLSVKNGIFNLTFFGFSFSQSDYDLIRELFIDDEKNESGKTDSGTIRNNLGKITIYCREEKSQYSCFLNLASCLGKKHLTAIKNKINFKIIKKEV